MPREQNESNAFRLKPVDSREGVPGERPSRSNDNIQFQPAATTTPIAAGAGAAREPEAVNGAEPPVGPSPVAAPKPAPAEAGVKELPSASGERSTQSGGVNPDREQGEEDSREFPDLSIPEFLRRAGDGWASHDKARA